MAFLLTMITLAAADLVFADANADSSTSDL